MLIKKTDKFDVTGKMLEHIERLNGKTDDKKIPSCFDKALEVFFYMIDSDVVEIECTENEISFILYDYVKTLSYKGNLAILAFVDSQVSVDTIEKVKILREYSTFIQVSPTGKSYKNKIKIFIGFFNEAFDKEYDVDYIVRVLFG